MRNSEFSDIFSVLLNSYATKADFGDQASHQEIALDEYEKSVYLTQAQDIIVKSYFYANQNPQGQGFDESERRQVDFSSLITTDTLHPVERQRTYTDRGSFTMMVGGFNYGTADVYNITQDPLTVVIEEKHLNDDVESTATISGSTIHIYFDVYNLSSGAGGGIDLDYILSKLQETEFDDGSGDAVRDYLELRTDSYQGTRDGNSAQVWFNKTLQKVGSYIVEESTAFDERGILYSLPKRVVDGVETDATDVLYILNEKLIATVNGVSTSYVIVPINYKEYDREMSKPFAQPLKKQAWRLFQNNSTGFDIKTELIPQWILTQKDNIDYTYKIRYVKRPRPIVLEKMPDGLSIEGYSDETTCELNPILHMDILQKAVELAIIGRGGRIVNNKA